MSMKQAQHGAVQAAQRPDRLPRRRGDDAEKPLVAPAAVTTPPAATPPAAEETQRYGRARVQKIFNFPEELADRLRREALKRSEEKGGRVTEKDIVIEALEAFLKG
jgi:hypothetical protein